MGMVKINYGGFWDRPLAFLVEHRNTLFLFWREFDDEADEYEDAYRVFALPYPPNPNLTIPVPWADCIEEDTNFIGTVKVADVQFDETNRQQINVNVLDKLLT